MRYIFFLSIFFLTATVASPVFARKYPFKEGDVDVILIDEIEDYSGSPFVVDSSSQSSGQSFFQLDTDDSLSLDQATADTPSAEPSVPGGGNGEAVEGTGIVVGTGEGGEFVAHSTVGGPVGDNAEAEESGSGDGTSDDLSFDGSFDGFGDSGGSSASQGEESVTALLEHLNISFSNSGSSSGDASTFEEPISVDQIFSIKDLQHFVDQEVKKDTAIKNVQILGQSITVEYTQPARLFGIFSISYTQKVIVTVSKSGMLEDVVFDKPWWTFFSSGDDTTQLEKQVRSEITRILEDGGSLSEEEVSGFLQRLGLLIDVLFAMLRNFGSSVKGLFG